jgi:hypothetical protein
MGRIMSVEFNCIARGGYISFLTSETTQNYWPTCPKRRICSYYNHSILKRLFVVSSHVSHCNEIRIIRLTPSKCIDRISLHLHRNKKTLKQNNRQYKQEQNPSFNSIMDMYNDRNRKSFKTSRYPEKFYKFRSSLLFKISIQTKISVICVHTWTIWLCRSQSGTSRTSRPRHLSRAGEFSLHRVHCCWTRRRCHLLVESLDLG